jgi:uncharacterized protein (DUF2249 family)
MLSLSTDAAPHLSLDDLDAACRTRGLDGEELVIQDAEPVERTAGRALALGARVVALRVAQFDRRMAPALARAAAVLDVPVSVPPGSVAPSDLGELAAIFAKTGSRLLLGHDTHLDDVIATISAIRAIGVVGAVGLAWEVRPSSAGLDDAAAMLLAMRRLLGVVRLHGGGPEQRDQEGRGVGELFVDLALSGYTGPIVLCPSRPEELPRWDRWLHSTRSAGCGHAVSASRVELDVRDVEPRDRLDTILGAYRRLARGTTLRLTVDHDPVCMYYTLQATEPEGSFSFEVVAHGPEIWRAEVRKH